jgi:hypothetical protein
VRLRIGGARRRVDDALDAGQRPVAALGHEYDAVPGRREMRRQMPELSGHVLMKEEQLQGLARSVRYFTR